MQVSLEWLNELVDLDGIEAEEIAHSLTMSGLEVEEIEIKKFKFTNIKTVKIVDLIPHPDADKLRLATVFTGNETKTVVCGAGNIEVGQIVPYASVGSKVYSRKTGELFELTPAKIRGVESQGMLCSVDELGLEELNLQSEDGILILNRINENIEAGKKLEDVLNLKEEVIFHIAPTANRGDQMSYVGVARELAALYNRTLNFSPLQAPNDLKTDNFNVEIIDSEACNYYSIAVIKNVNIMPSPSWMQKRLLASGMRPINNVVDITNYVLLETGSPLHAFDSDKLNGYLCVRYAKEGEELVTIDETNRKLNKDTVVIADQNKPVCVGGVFGGLNSEIDNNTKNIALEAAYFTPSKNRLSARSIGYRSEASARFERGVDIEAVKPALLRAADLLIKYADAKIEGIVETGNNKASEIEITLRYPQIKRMLGIEIPTSKCKEICENLGFEVIGSNDLALKVKVPSWRTYDVYREIDLIEEISRIYGYDKIEPTIPLDSIFPEISQEQRALKKINELFLGYGFNEIVTTSFVGKPLLKELDCPYEENKAVKVTNPQSEDHTMLRQSLMPALFETVKLNFDNADKNLRLYEIGKTYIITGQADLKNTGVSEKRILAGVLSGDVNNEKWIKSPELSFYSIKGVIESLFETLGLKNRIKFLPNEQSVYLHPYKSAQIGLLGKDKLSLGQFGLLHPLRKEKMKLQQDIYIFELDLELILDSITNSTVKFKKLPQFPKVQRDIAFITDKNTTYEEISKIIKKSADKNLFKGSELFDIYKGESLGENKMSMAFRIYLQDEASTLTDEIIDGQINKIKKGLKESGQNITFRE